MNDEAALRDKLRKIEALFAGAATAGEAAASTPSAISPRAGCSRSSRERVRAHLPISWAR